ncbi:MAG: ATP-dependent DNA helicase RecG [Armatimonadota bacterium]
MCYFAAEMAADDSSSPDLSLDVLIGPLKLEERKGYADQAVFGGLGPFVERVAAAVAEAAGSDQARELLKELRSRFAGYAGASVEERAEAVARAREIIEALSGGAAAPTRERAARPRPPDPAPPPKVRGLAAPVTVLRGISTARAKLLANLGIATVGDLLRHYPTRHEDRREITPVDELPEGRTASVVGEVEAPGEAIRRGRRRIAKVPLRDDRATVYLTWFGQDFRATQFKPGTTLFATGTVKYYRGAPHLQAPEVEIVGRGDPLHVGRIVPIYPLTKGLFMPQLRRMVHAAIQGFAQLVPEMLPADVISRHNLCGAEYAVRNIHFPEDEEALAAAKRRLTFEELFRLQLQLARMRYELKSEEEGVALEVEPEYLEQFEAALDFELTQAQRRAIAELAEDLSSPQPGNRLLHGDVGSGKTAVAAWGLYATARNGYQGAFMAPTEILAEQHHRVLSELLGPLGLEVALLIGGLRRGKRELQRRIGAGQVPVVVGTHALIQEAVSFARLGLAIIDEQHRFGVTQRAALREKGYHPNVLVMTATPIPRTLALTVYGDFDISVLDEMPPGRQEVVTEVLTMRQRPRAYEFVRQEVREGKQAFIVCPLVEESEKLDDVRAATELARRLQKDIFPDLRVGLIHGRMAVEDKDDIMAAFRRANLDVLCSTTVVEVGVDIPNASVMVVENAERFGLAQLHQLRGRVGRGQHLSHCLLLAGRKSGEAWERLQVLAETTDGFKIAEADLRLRGPGEFYGTRQHGLPDLKMADIMADTPALVQARQEAFELIERDPQLSEAEHALLRQDLESRLGELPERVEVS